MIARFAILAGALALSLPAGAALAQKGFGSAAAVAAAVGATASPPIAGGSGYTPVPVARPVDETIVTTGSIARAPRAHVGKPRR